MAREDNTPWNAGTKGQGVMKAWNKGIPSGIKTQGCFKKGNIPWNKGLTKETDPRVSKKD
jgi:hypothetical protein